MLKLEFNISNDAAKAARSEIRHFLNFETKKLTGDMRDRDDTAALGYVILRQMLERVEAHLRALEKEDRDRVRAATPTVRERRAVHANRAQKNG